MRGGTFQQGEARVQQLFEQVILTVQRLEHALSDQLEPIRKDAEQRSEMDFVVRHGIEGFRRKIETAYEQQAAFNPQAWVAQIVQKDPSLRFPHRKILEFLARQYDYQEKRFKVVNYSRIVKECRLGRRRAKGYLQELGTKQVISRSTDGCRIFYFASPTALQSC